MAGFTFFFLSTEPIYSLTYKTFTLEEPHVRIIHLCETHIVKKHII